MNYTQQRRHAEHVAQRSSSCGQLNSRTPQPLTWGELLEQAQYMQKTQNSQQESFGAEPSPLQRNVIHRSNHVQGVINSGTGQLRPKNKKKLSKLKRIIVSERASKALNQAYQMWSEAKVQVEESTKELENLISVLNESLEKQKLEENSGIIDPGTQSQIHVLNVVISEALKRVQALELKVKNASDELEKQKQLSITANAAASSESSADIYGSSTLTGISETGRGQSQCVMVGGKCVPASAANMDQWLPTVMTRVEQQTGIQMQQNQVELLLRQAGILSGPEHDVVLTQQLAGDVAKHIVQPQQLVTNSNFHALTTPQPPTLQSQNQSSPAPKNGSCCGPRSSCCPKPPSLQQQQQLSLLHYVSSQGSTSVQQFNQWEQSQQNSTSTVINSIQQQQHLLQQKYEQQLLSQQCCNLLEMLSLRTGGSSDVEVPTVGCGQEQLQQSQDLYCEVCDKTCNSLTNYLQHVQSRKHAQKLQLRGGSQSVIEEGRGGGDASSTGARSEALHTTYVGIDAQCREYCKQVITTDLNAVVIDFLQTLYKFQERQMVNDPMNAKARRRMVSGLREVGKVVRGKKAKCVILAPNIEHIESEGGLDDKLVELLNMCQQNSTEVIYALSRKRLGQVFGSRKKMSAIAILDFSGAQEMYSKMKQMAQQGRLQWQQHNSAPGQCNGAAGQ